MDGNHGEIHPKGSDFTEAGIPFIMATDIMNGKIDLHNCKFISVEQSRKLRKGFSLSKDVLLTHKASIGRTAIVPELDTDYIMLTPQVTYYRVLDKSVLNHKYLKYYFDSSLFQQTLSSYANSGSTRAYIGITEQLNLPIILPPIKVQDRIASILSSLDDKIELNLQMNKTLESIAQAIIKEWFVDFRFPGFDGELEDGIPKGWRKGKLAEIVEIKNGYAFKGTDFMEEGIPVIKIKNVKPNKILLKELSYVSHEMSIKTQRFRINHEDILITMSGNRIDGGKDTWVGKVAIFMRDGEFLLNQRVSILRLDKSRKFFKYYLAILLSSDTYQDYFIKNATSSGGQANISPDLVNNTDILIPPTAILGLYHKVIEPIFNKISANDNEIDTLSSLRDTLLPKLMTGKIRVA